MRGKAIPVKMKIFDKISADVMTMAATLPSTSERNMNKAAAIAGVSAGVLGTAMCAYADTASDVAQALGDQLSNVFKALQNIGAPLIGVAIVICLLGIGFCVLTGDSKGIGTWKAGIMTAVVVLVLIYAVPIIVDWARNFGKDINKDKTINFGTT